MASSPSRIIRYRQIASELRTRIDAGEFGAGQILPSESAMSKEYRASRVTIRKSLDVLRDEGRVESRQGFGWSVTADPLPQSLARLGTIEDQLEASHRTSQREVLSFAFVPAPERAASVLGEGTVLEVTRRNLADGQPFARVTVWCPEHLGGKLTRNDVAASPFYDLLGLNLASATQTIGAGAADDSDAELLGIPTGSPVLVCRRVTRDTSGDPVLVSEHVFPSHATEFVVELAQASESMARTGLRLVESPAS